MFQWTYDRIKEVDQHRSPFFSLQATINWFTALLYEIEYAHGDTPSEQLSSCRSFYSMNIPKSTITKPTGSIIEPLFFSILYCMSLERIAISLNDIPWILPTAIVDWYYSVYFSIRSIIESNGQPVRYEHSAAAKFLANNLRDHLPYPLNIYARRVRNEEYEIELDGCKNPPPFDLWHDFINDRSCSKGMLCQYLYGTARWYAGRAKQKILMNHKEIDNFRTKHARVIRDKQLMERVGFLHCAYRQRVKANYHDSIFLAYNNDLDIDISKFLINLSSIARFVSISAMGFIGVNNGNRVIDRFIKDLRENLRGLNLATTLERYWEIP